MSRVITSTYRLQLRREFPLAAARALVPYFHELGISHLYLSPVLAARAGSPHGYDVIDSARVNQELGSEDDLRALAGDLHALDMGIILDIVPNHMAAVEANPYWDNLLERGNESRYASWFDIDWTAPRAKGRVVLPVLGDELDTVLDRGELTPRIRDSGARIAYFDRTFPLDPATLPKELQLAQWDPSGRPAADDWASGTAGRARIQQLLHAQHYRLTCWRNTGDINYRRFFDINDLVGVRVEDEAVFQATHALVLRWVREGLLDGLRIDHIDGLRLPAWYLAKLRAEVDAARHADAPEPFSIHVEKILSTDERLPTEWPVQGTTGYDFLNDVEDLFLEPRGFEAIEAGYRALRHNPALNYRSVSEDGKRRALTGPLWTDVLRAARLAHAWRLDVPVREVADAIVELIVHLGPYRTYVSDPGVASASDRATLTRALLGARARAGASLEALRLLEDAFLAPPSASDAARADLVMRIQQTSGPATAKGVEDTALYVYMPLASRNEVGGAPDRTLPDAHVRLHAGNADRAREWPGAMLSTDTHDTKRSADLRARLDVLTTRPEDWSRHVGRWRRLNKSRRRTVRGKLTPDTNAEYLFYQTLFGLWPAPRPERRADDLPGREWRESAKDRLTAYMLKAAREAKTRTSWTEGDPQYEQALQQFVRETLLPDAETHFLPDVARLTAVAAHTGFEISLARTLIQFLSPGIPDIYQGSECWSFTLVDPDNRRPVDFTLRATALRELRDDAVMTEALASRRLFEQRTKLALVARLLRFRREHAGLVTRGEYLPLHASGDDASQVFAFARRWHDERCVAVARTRFGRDSAAPAPPMTLPQEFDGSWRSVLSGRVVHPSRPGQRLRLTVGELLQPDCACELLVPNR